jgi:hypothetical protein
MSTWPTTYKNPESPPEHATSHWVNFLRVLSLVFLRYQIVPYHHVHTYLQSIDHQTNQQFALSPVHGYLPTYKKCVSNTRILPLGLHKLSTTVLNAYHSSVAVSTRAVHNWDFFTHISWSHTVYHLSWPCQPMHAIHLPWILMMDHPDHCPYKLTAHTPAMIWTSNTPGAQAI